MTMTTTADTPKKRKHRGGMPSRRRRSRSKAIAAIGVLAERWPETFRVIGQRQPLKIGIFEDIVVAVAGVIKSSEIHSALAFYTGHILYLRALKDGTQRIDLQGNPAGSVTADEAAHARERLKCIEALRKERKRADVAADMGAGAS